MARSCGLRKFTTYRVPVVALTLFLASYDTTEAWHRKDKKTQPFTKVCPNWADDFPTSFVRFCRPVLFPGEVDADDLDDGKSQRPRNKPAPVVFEFYPEGDPILPDIEDVRNVYPKRVAFRRFVTAHYGMSCQPTW